jgi:hypothetical protein
MGWAGHAQVPNTPPAIANRSRSGAEFITRETEDAIREGLDYLARSQYSDGSFMERADRAPAAVGITSLASLALMAGGNQPGRGKYGKEISRAVDFVSSMANGPLPGFLTIPESQGRMLASQPGPMYSHGFGTLFLSEVCGMLPVAVRDTKVRKALEQAVAFTVDAQNNDGGFSYWHGQGFSAFARTAAAIVGLYSAGIYESKEIERGLKYLQNFTPGRQFSTREIPPQHYWYGQYYAALAMWTAGEEYWTPWFPAIRDELLSRRRSSGSSWSDPYHGPAYATAMALIILQLPNNYLPILQK